MRASTISLVALAALLSGCPEPSIPDDIYGDRLGDPVPFASPEQLEAFDRGEEVALRRFTPEDGLGPRFNLASCGGCHETPVFGGGGPRYRNFLIVRDELPDGTQVDLGVNGIQTHYDVTTSRTPTADGNVAATRNPIPFFGTGLIAEIDESAILANADPDDRDGDGISGRPNFDRGFVGRFGRKAQTISIEGFIRGPLFNHLGLTSDPLSNRLRNQLPVPSGVPEEAPEGGTSRREDGLGSVTSAQAGAPDEPNADDDGIPDPELSEQDLFDLISWSMLLAPPEPDPPTPMSEAGEARFDELNCSGCHIPALESPRGLVPAYSDFLLHDMGQDMADGLRMGQSEPSEFRTQPLWGVVASPPYLHDGRADTLDEAIRFHGGEASASRDAYLALDDQGREEVLEFLRSLGGRSQFTPGLVAPGTVFEEGEFGGPLPGLSDAEAALFERGKDLADRNVFRSEGLGPVFNGDSCRACHFDPVIGGSGPIDVNVIRQYELDDGEPAVPAMGSVTHRFNHDSTRPGISPDAAAFEMRQTPAMFGLGLIDRIPEEAILAFADPDDADEDGISGRAHRLSNGFVGRFGWKAQIQSVRAFVGDALTVELGMTVPEEAELEFAAIEDDDDVPDPEFSMEDIDALTFWLENLAPPPRAEVEGAAAGEAVFAEVGCGDCHFNYTLEDGTEVALYSDLLLHDVMPSTAMGGVPDDDATAREFRTPPLWGIRETAPYMHDGRSATLEDAIARHFSEGAASAEAFSALGPADREALLAFLRSL